MEGIRHTWVEPVVPPPPRPPAGSIVGDRPIAGYGYRVAAFLFDAGFAFAVGVLITYLAGGGERWSSGGDTLFLLSTIGAWLVITTGAMAVLHGQTLGKRLVGTRVIGPGGPADFGTSVLRDQLARLLYFVPFFGFADIIWAAADAERRSLRDKMVGTYVVREGGTTRRALAVTAVAVGLFVVYVNGTSAMNGDSDGLGGGYTAAERATFVDACRDEGGTRGECGCLFAYVSARVPHDEFAGVRSDDVRDWPKHLQRVSRAAARSCMGGGEPSPASPGTQPA
jgi:uncharacterized RDD family membrane protein YckC